MKFISSHPLSIESLIDNRALNYGDGLFETMLFENGKVKLWEFHWQRLSEGLEALGIEQINKNQIESDIKKLTNQESFAKIIKIIVYRSGVANSYAANENKAEYIIKAKSFTNQKNIESLGLSSVKLKNNKSLAKHKHINRLEQVLAANETKQSKYDDAVLCDENKNIIETTNKNIIIIKGNKVFTPNLQSNGVHGVALRWLERNRAVHWQKIPIDTIDQFDSMLVCNSIRGFQEIKSFQSIQFKTDTAIIKSIKKDWESRK